MVRFFNQKEEVLEIQLTSYGREMFAKGKLAPEFYAFYDSSIIYDGEYADITETQNQVTNRISNETPRLKPIARFNSSPGSVYSLSTARNEDDFSQGNDWNTAFYRTLGNSDPNSSYAPSWSVRVLNISDSGFNDGILYKNSNTIPQVSASLYIDYETITEPDQESTIYTLVKSEKLVLDVEELNTIFNSNSNFDIEVLSSGSDGVLNSLGFINNQANNSYILTEQLDPFSLAETINGTEEEINNNFPILDESYVEFFLDISVDDEIVGIPVRTNSSLYKQDIERNAVDICDLVPGGGFD